MEKLKIMEAMGYYSYKTGKSISRKELSEKLWPNSTDKARQTNMSKLLRGETKRIDIEHVRIICETLDVDANFLFDVKPMKK